MKHPLVPEYNASKPTYNRIGYILRKSGEYKKTGNDEILVDIANMALYDYVEGTHPKKHLDDTTYPKNIEYDKIDDRMEYIYEKAKEYMETGNDAIFVDIANAAFYEFVKGEHPQKNFKAEDDTSHMEKIP
jgi:hypothetical protein